MKHEGSKHRQEHAEEYLRRAGHTVEHPKMPEPKGHDTKSHNSEARDTDYFGNLKKFERHDDMAAEPTRGKAGEPRRKP